MNSAVIVASGKSVRFGNKTPKQFVRINNQEIKPDKLFDYIRHYTIDELLKALKSHNNAELHQIIDTLIGYIQSFGIMNENINAIHIS